ncbi:MAG: MBL fold metallo-hydrolase, partial [bacterium]|nr:MBL fold metallo-hydrolase [bacterium]
MNKIAGKSKYIISWTLLLLALILLFLYFQIPDHKFHIYFLDVGQGDAIFIKTPENHQILIDGGPQNNVIEELTDIIPFFDKSIDLIVLTHPHADHLSGLIHVLKRYKVDSVLIAGIDYESSYYDEFLAEILDSQIFVAEASTDFLFGDVLLDVIYPKNQLLGESFSNLNNSSIVLSVNYGPNVILLTGDLE